MLTAGFQCLLSEIKKKKKDGEKKNLGKFIESCHGHPSDTKQWYGACLQIQSHVIVDDGIQRVGKVADAVETERTRGGTVQ